MPRIKTTKPAPAQKTAFRQTAGYASPGKVHTPSPAPAGRLPAEELRSRSEAPKPVATHTSDANDEKRREVSKADSKARGKLVAAAERAQLVAALISGASKLNRTILDSLPAPSLCEVCRGRKLKGFSSLTKPELIDFILDGGKKPGAKKDSSRWVREKAAELKKAGAIVGPVSALKVSALKDIVAKASVGSPVTVEKPAPKAGTMDYHKNLLRQGQAKGFPATVTARCKADFGVSVSALKAKQLKTLCKTMNLI